MSADERGLARCAEHVLGAPRGSAPEDRAALGEWLAGRGFALTFVAEPESFELPGAFLARRREGWTVDGIVAYSKLCTHVGCPVGLYQATSGLLLCPCHQSTFDVMDGAEPVFGPAARPLPQLPLDVDGDGYLIATGDFSDPVGPGFWDRGR